MVVQQVFCALEVSAPGHGVVKIFVELWHKSFDFKHNVLIVACSLVSIVASHHDDMEIFVVFPFNVHLMSLWLQLPFAGIGCHLQGLAPHHDDVEIFVCQTEGSKRWRLYDFRKGFAKPSQPSGDLAEDSLGEPIMDVTLQVLQTLMPYITNIPDCNLMFSLASESEECFLISSSR